jgi:hypothetical protein
MIIIENENLSIKLIEGRIFHLFVKDFCSATYSDMTQAFTGISEYCTQNCMNQYGMLLIELGHGANADKGAREYTATKAANKFTRGAAILVENASQQLLGDYYIRFNRPPYPNKVFYKKPEALRWLRDQLANFNQ